MSLRVVLYAEGSLETFAGRIPPAPGEPLGEDELGPAHVLIRRAIVRVRGVPEGAVRFESPLRTRGRLPVGSDLLVEQTLKQLLTWLEPTRRPDLAVVLVDQDEDAGRRKFLRENVKELPFQPVIAIAIQEFEAWLIGDIGAVSRALGASLDTPAAPETMKRREAKSLLAKWIADREDARRVRIGIAVACDLDVLGSRCPSFAQLVADLR